MELRGRATAAIPRMLAQEHGEVEKPRSSRRRISMHLGSEAHGHFGLVYISCLLLHVILPHRCSAHLSVLYSIYIPQLLYTISMSVNVPFAEPPWLNGLPSAYYNDSHRKWQKTVREFVDKTFMEKGGEWEAAGDVPESLYKTVADANMLIPNMGAPLPVKDLKRIGIHELPGGLKVEDFDYLHTSIYIDELARCGTGGPTGAVTVGAAFGLPPIIKYGNQALKDRFVEPIVKGSKRICIAITEPGAGSDVANIETTAVKSKDGKSYIVNGTKKW